MGLLRSLPLLRGLALLRSLALLLRSLPLLRGLALLRSLPLLLRSPPLLLRSLPLLRGLALLRSPPLLLRSPPLSSLPLLRSPPLLLRSPKSLPLWSLVSLCLARGRSLVLVLARPRPQKLRMPPKLIPRLLLRRRSCISLLEALAHWSASAATMRSRRLPLPQSWTLLRQNSAKTPRWKALLCAPSAGLASAPRPPAIAASLLTQLPSFPCTKASLSRLVSATSTANQPSAPLCLRSRAGTHGTSVFRAASTTVTLWPTLKILTFGPICTFPNFVVITRNPI